MKHFLKMNSNYVIFLDDPFHHTRLSYGILIFFQILWYEVQSDVVEYLSSKVKPPTKT